MILTEDGFVKHELTRDEEDDILNEYYGQKCGSADHMTKEKSSWRSISNGEELLNYRIA